MDLKSSDKISCNIKNVEDLTEILRIVRKLQKFKISYKYKKNDFIISFDWFKIKIYKLSYILITMYQEFVNLFHDHSEEAKSDEKVNN